MSQSLVNKYNVAGPRYTSYPTVPYWDENTFSLENWKLSVKRAFDESNTRDGLSLYIHLPFCESLCTFCGCHKRITKRHEVESPYINALLKEWDLYCQLFEEKPILKEIHLGGGTPTFFEPKNLKQLIDGILDKSVLARDYEFSFEGHPNNTTKEHLQTFYDLGFRRVSFGVQDYNLTVQKAINRIQPFENVERVTTWSREIGYTSISHDIIFGLPFQTESHVIETIAKTKALLPDRIAFYSYAHVPWIKGTGQRGYDESNLPSPEIKRKQYENGKIELAKAGYHEIGMDHFGLKSDSLYKAIETGSIHRNFMGYTASKTQLMIGLGVSSIGDSWYGFGQNIKDIKTYYQVLEENKIPVYRGHILNTEDLAIRQHILNIMCKFKTSWVEDDFFFTTLGGVLPRLEEFKTDGLIEVEGGTLTVTEKGRPFVRNICMAFDVLLQAKKPHTQLFSMTI